MNDEKLTKTYTLTVRQIEMLEELAVKEDRTKSAILGRAIEQYYQSRGEQ